MPDDVKIWLWVQKTGLAVHIYRVMWRYGNDGWQITAGAPFPNTEVLPGLQVY